jgi:sec-independent protein translocase protein TatA
MNEMALGTTEILLIFGVVVLLFGASRLPQLAKSLGQSKRAFREGQEEAEEEARLERERRANVAPQQSQLADVNDEQLFEEARRRAATLRSAEASGQKKD